jgi:hypothetical protein
MRSALWLCLLCACASRSSPPTQAGSGAPERCGYTDPQCRPVPYSQAPYWPDHERRLVGDQVPELRGLSWGRCDHDGACQRGGCGNFCMPVSDTEHTVGTCQAYTHLEPALCGCVDNQCAWFTQ